jgi:L-malate glycosyltransferase
MRILYFTRGYTEHDRRFLAELAGAGHHAALLKLEHSARDQRPLPAHVELLETPWSLPSGAGPAQCAQVAARFQALAGRFRPDAIHAGPVQTCGYITALSGLRPWLLMSWGYDMLVDADRDEEWRRATKFALERADLFFCDCEAVAQRAVEIAAFPAGRILKFPWGVDPAVFAPGDDTLSLRARLPGWSGATILLSTRSWEPLYGTSVLLEAFLRAYRVNPCLRLLLAGGGSEAEMAGRFVASQSLDAVVHMAGRIAPQDLPAWYRAADVYISCSYTDGSSVSLLEAMATGLPAIVSDVPGNREWIAAENGRLAAPGEPAEFARAILELADAGRADRSRMAAANRRVIEARANWPANVPVLLAAYERLGRP